MRVTPKGTAICQFGLAVNRKFKDEAGQIKEDTTFVELEAWGKTAETIDRYLTKGSPLYVEGRLKMDQWEDKESHQKRSKMKVTVDTFQFLGAPAGADQKGRKDEMECDEGMAGDELDAELAGAREKIPF